MIHPVKIIAYDPAGSITFEMHGVRLTARHGIPAPEAEGLLVPGKSYPLELTLDSSEPVAYLAGPGTAFAASGMVKGVSLVRSQGRIMDYLAHDTIRLEGDVTVAVRLRLPQQSTDYRRGSWLEAVGVLEAALPSPDHQESGLKGSIVE